VLHIFVQVLFWAGNQDNHQNSDPSLLPKKLTDFHGDEAKKRDSKWRTQKKLSLSISPILNMYLRKFQGLVFALVG
jgi:hypothetical protein